MKIKYIFFAHTRIIIHNIISLNYYYQKINYYLNYLSELF